VRPELGACAGDPQTASFLATFHTTTLQHHIQMLAVPASGMGLRLCPSKMSLSPIVKHTGHESRGEFSYFDCFCSQNMSNCSEGPRLQDPLPGLCATPLGTGIIWAIAPQVKIPVAALEY